MDLPIPNSAISVSHFASSEALPIADRNLDLLINYILRKPLWASPNEPEPTIITKNLIALYQLTAHFEDAFQSSTVTPTLTFPSAIIDLSDYLDVNTITWNSIQTLWLRADCIYGHKEFESLGVRNLAATLVERFDALRELHQVEIEDLVEGIAEPANPLVGLLVRLVAEHKRFATTGQPKLRIAGFDDEDEEDDPTRFSIELANVLGERLCSWTEAVGADGSSEQWTTMWPAIAPAERPEEPTFEKIVKDHRKQRQIKLQKLINESSYTIRLPPLKDPYRPDQIQVLSSHFNVRRTIRQGTMVTSESANQKGVVSRKYKVFKSKPATRSTRGSSARATAAPDTPDVSATLLFPRLPQSSGYEQTSAPPSPGATPPLEDAEPKTCYTARFCIKQTGVPDPEKVPFVLHGCWHDENPPTVRTQEHDEWTVEAGWKVKGEQTANLPGRLDKDVYVALQEPAMGVKLEQWARFTKRRSGAAVQAARDAMINGFDGVFDGEERPVSFVVELEIEKHDGAVILMETPEGWDIEGPFRDECLPRADRVDETVYIGASAWLRNVLEERLDDCQILPMQDWIRRQMAGI